MKNNKKPGIVLTFESDPVGTLVNLLRQPLEAYVDLAPLRDHFDYKTITDAMTKAMAHPALAERYLGIAWDDEMGLLGHLPQRSLALLIMPAILNTHAGLLRPLADKFYNEYRAEETFEVMDTYIFRDIDVYKASEVIGRNDHHKDAYLDRLLACRLAALKITPERLSESLKTPSGISFHDAWKNDAVSSNWYRMAVSIDFGSNPVGKMLAHHLLLSGPEGSHNWAYEKRLDKLANPSWGVKRDEYLNLVDSFFSCKQKEKLHEPKYADTLEKIYLELYKKLSMNEQKSKDVSTQNEWVISAIREFHRLFFKPDNGFVQQMRANPERHANTLSQVFVLMKMPKSAQNIGLMAEFVSAMTGDGPLFKTGHGAMAHSLVQFANAPVDLLRQPDTRYAEIKQYLTRVFSEIRNQGKIVEAFELIDNSKQALFFGRIWPEAIKSRKNPWLRDQRMGQDLGL